MGDTGPLSETAAAVGGHFKQRYGGLSNIAETIRTDPVGALADVGAVASATPRIRNVPVPKVNLPLYGQFPKTAQTVGDLNPFRIGGAATSGSAEFAGQRLKGGGIRMYEKVLKPSMPEERGIQGVSEAKRAAVTGLEAGIIPSMKPARVPLLEQAREVGLLPQDLRHIPPNIREDVLFKVGIMEAKAGKEVSGSIADLQAKGFKLDRAGKHQIVQDAVDYVKSKHPGATSEVHAEIQDIGNREKIAAFPVPGQPGAFMSDEMTPTMMQSRKRELQSGQVYGAEPGKTTPTKLEDQTYRAIAYELAKKLEEWEPRLAEANPNSADAKLLRKALVNFVRRMSSGEPPQRTQTGYWAGRALPMAAGAMIGGGLGVAAGGGAAMGAGAGAIGALASLAIQRPSIKSSIARNIYRVGKTVEKSGAMAGSAIRTSGVPEALAVGQRTLVEPQRETSKSGRSIVSHDGGKTWEYE
jgi:hypothetical protein